MTPTSDAPRVAFSHDVFGAQRTGGISRSMIELMRSLAPAQVDWTAWAGAHANTMLLEAKAEGWTQGRVVDEPRRRPGRIPAALRNEPGFARWVAREEIEIVHRTYYPVIDLVRSRTRHVETLHDMSAERPDVHNDSGAPLRSWLKRRALRRADLIVCVSEHSRDELLSIWPWTKGRVKVIPHGVRPLAENPSPAGFARPYFLFVGRRGFYKNFRVALEGLRRSGLSEHGLVCFGGGPFASAERAWIADAGLGGRVVQVDGGDARLAGLYEAASALLYPSSYEGFGLPLLEAMIHDCPAIATPLTSLPEVGGGAALYAAPDDADAWAAAMVQMACDLDAAARLRALGRERAARFSWNRAAEAHAESYRSLL